MLTGYPPMGTLHGVALAGDEGGLLVGDGLRVELRERVGGAPERVVHLRLRLVVRTPLLPRVTRRLHPEDGRGTGRRTFWKLSPEQGRR